MGRPFPLNERPRRGLVRISGPLGAKEGEGEMNLLHRRKRDRPDHLTAGELGHSQYGTPLDEIIHAKAGCDPLKWIMVPAVWGGHWSGPEHWANEAGPE